MTPEQTVRDAVEASIDAQRRLLDDETVSAITSGAALLSACLRDGGTILLFGNGGSAADATHIAAEFVGRFLRERRSLPALSLSDNASSVTAIANDFGYEHVFSRQVEGLGRAGDVAVGISTSGTSANVVAGLRAARDRGLRTIGLTGGDGGEMTALCDVCIVAASDQTPRIQECHTLIAHLLCDLAERDLG